MTKSDQQLAAQDKRREKAQDRKALKRRAELVGFVNYTPSERDRESFEDWYSDQEMVHNDVLFALQGGWKLGLAVPDSDGIAIASVSTWDASHPQAGIILNLRTKDVKRALDKVVYALTHVYGYDLIPHVARRNGENLF